ncbi:MAG: PIN domain-containing protein [Solirubrobacteraceae bacterium]
MPPGAELYGGGAPLVVDTSAWNRQRHELVSPRWQASLAAGILAVCPVVSLELLASARDELAFRGLDHALNALPQAPVTRAACERALAVSRELGGRRRLPAMDYLIAAAAAERGFGVLHYDRHFEPLCDVMGIESVLVAQRGVLD